MTVSGTNADDATTHLENTAYPGQDGPFDAAVDATAKVKNQSGTVLPSTGGIGTTIFYVLGGLMVIGAGIILVARRKASE